MVYLRRLLLDVALDVALGALVGGGGGGWGVSVHGAEDVLVSLTALEERWGGSSTWVVGSNVHYAPFVEFGTSRMAAQPFLRPAANQTMRRAETIADDADDGDDFVRLLALNVEREAKHRCPVDTGTLRASISAEPRD